MFAIKLMTLSFKCNSRDFLTWIKHHSWIIRISFTLYFSTSLKMPLLYVWYSRLPLSISSPMLFRRDLTLHHKRPLFHGVYDLPFFTLFVHSSPYLIFIFLSLLITCPNFRIFICRNFCWPPPLQGTPSLFSAMMHRSKCFWESKLAIQCLKM